ncbi:MAG: hypothetical protein CML42_09885 [Rhodobacteraceae bacterium]|nr:hypothetical protein [Paracoccaceae bacterium]
MESNNPVMRYVTIGEVLDKQFDDKTKGVVRQTNKKLDDNLQSTFSIGNDSEGMGWFYTHGDGTVDKLDKDFGLKHYILMGFECREVGPTSNNKQSSRSHVVVSLELDMGEGVEPRSVFVCDLAGVENVFDCTPGSTDSIRMKAKTRANKNYSNDLGKGNIEEWKNLKKKRVGNIVKYVHSGIHIGTSTPEDPNCWPDGSPNEAGDIGEITDQFSKELMKIFYYYSIERKNIMAAGQSGGVNRKKKKKKKSRNLLKLLDVEDVLEYFKKKLLILPLKKDGDSFVGWDKVKANIKSFWSDAEGRRFNQFLKGLDARGEHVKFKYVTKAQADKIDWDVWAAISTGNGGKGDAGLQSCKIVFNDLEAPDCVTAYSQGYKSACEIRRNEGYIINNTLAQLTKDIKRIAKYAIKERLEYEAVPLIGVEGVKRAQDFPCLYADTIDNYDYYATTTSPLMDWYDIDDPTQEDFGMILSAMCLLKEQSPEKWSNPKTGKKEKMNFLKQFKFVMCTVLNETYVMNFGGKDAKTPAGNLIYVNNPPLPPFINCGILEQSYKEFAFYERDPRNDEKKYAAFLKLYNNFLNLIVKMFKHPNYEEFAIKLMQGLGQVAGQQPKLIFFESEEDIKSNFNDPGTVQYIKDKTAEMLTVVKKNNNATYIGTIQTTEEVNRVSDKIIISEAINQEAKFSSIDEKNINVILLKKLFVSCYLYDGPDGANIFENDTGNLRREKTTKKQETSTILYECLYEIDKLSREKNMLKQCKTMKERDLEAMMNAMETVFPIMTRYIDPDKLEWIWNRVSALERSKTLVASAEDGEKYGMYGEPDKQSYPFGDDMMKTSNGSLVASGSYDWNDNFQKVLKTIQSADSPLLEFNNYITGVIKKEPSIPFLTEMIWNEEKGKANGRPYTGPLQTFGPGWGFGYEGHKKSKNKYSKKKGKKIKTYPSLKHFWNSIGFKPKENAKTSVINWFASNNFVTGLYSAYQAESFKAPNKWDPEKSLFPEFSAVKSAKVKKLVGSNDQLSIHGVGVSYPPDTFRSRKKARAKGAGGGKQNSRKKNKKPKRKQTRRKNNL